MNASSPLIDAVLTEVIWVIGAGVLGLVATLAALFMASARRRVPPVLGAAGVGLVALAALGGGLGGLFNPDLYTGTLASGIIHLVAAFAAFPMAGLLLLGTAVIAFRDGPRQKGLPLAVAGLVAIAVVATVIEGHMGANTRFGYVRAVVITGLGVLTVLSTMSAHPDSGDTTATSGVAFALAVGVIESAERGMAASLGLKLTVDIVEPAKRPEAIEQMLALVAPAVPYTWLTTLAGLGVGLLTVGWVLRQRGMRAGDVAALLWLALVPTLLVVGMPGASSLEAAAAAGPPPRAERQAEPAP